MTVDEFKEVLDRIPVRKFSKYAVKADNQILLQDRNRLYDFRLLLQNKNNIDNDFKIAGRVIAEIYLSQQFYAVPLLIRGVMYYLAYTAYSLRDVDHTCKLYMLRKYSYPKLIVRAVNNAFDELGRQKKYWTDKTFSSGKWAMQPLEDYCNNVLGQSATSQQNIGSQVKASVQTTVLNKSSVAQANAYIVPTLDFSYAGHKDGYLGYMLSKLIENVNYKTYVELYGGSGIGIMQHPFKHGTEEYINDMDNRNVCYYKVISDRFDDFIAKCNRVVSEIKSKANINIFNSGKRDYALRMYRKLTGKKSTKVWDTWILSYIENLISNELGVADAKHIEAYNVIALEPSREEIEYCIGLWKYYSNYTPTIDIAGKDELEVAFSFYFSNFFLYGGKDKSISGAQPKTVSTFLKKDFKQDLVLYSQRMAQVKKLIPNDAVPYINSYDGINTFFYSDSPYISTSGYQGLPPFELNEMQILVNSLLNSKGKWIFSCKNGVEKNKHKGIGEEDVYAYEELVNLDNKIAPIALKYLTKKPNGERKISMNFIIKKYGSDVANIINELDDLKIPKKYLPELDVKAKKYYIAETLKMFKDMRNELFVYYLGKNGVEPKRELQGTVVGSMPFEIMISNIDCTVPNYEEYVASEYYVKKAKMTKNVKKNNNIIVYDEYKKVNFNEFLSWELDVL
ncbi:hypothetical protein [[Clostridium] fimetarium]|uniref:Uncharacterized protein n=1 Tax=[Clostridium] fimetarium TaxID=99656 RepID=A0A1I0RDW8_9FIRM|nr:hypothetical protein [[Clostridium] fimetarium]SEW39028.1 hypothetical protein SAMN05421659_11483 [[Clostridium] fimetarium]